MTEAGLILKASLGTKESHVVLHNTRRLRALWAAMKIKEFEEAALGQDYQYPLMSLLLQILSRR